MPPDEGGRHPVRPGADEDGRGLGHHASPTVGADAPVGVVEKERDPLAIHRDVDVLDAGVCPGGEGHPEDIFGVGREDMIRHQPAAAAVGRPLDLVPRMLRQVLRVGVGVVHRPAQALADCKAGDGAGRVQIRLEQGGGKRLRIGDVVEVGAHRIQRQPVSGVHLEVQQIANCLLVLRPVEALEGPAARVGGERGGLVEPVLQGLHQRQQRGAAGAAGLGRRHHAGAQLPDHLLGDIGVFGRVPHIELLERQLPLRERSLWHMTQVLRTTRLGLGVRRDRLAGLPGAGGRGGGDGTRGGGPEGGGRDGEQRAEPALRDGPCPLPGAHLPCLQFHGGTVMGGRLHGYLPMKPGDNSSTWRMGQCARSTIGMQVSGSRRGGSRSHRRHPSKPDRPSARTPLSETRRRRRRRRPQPSVPRTRSDRVSRRPRRGMSFLPLEKARVFGAAMIRSA